MLPTQRRRNVLGGGGDFRTRSLWRLGFLETVDSRARAPALITLMAEAVKLLAEGKALLAAGYAASAMQLFDA